jgi:X-X-X-Leu-X-X-Gly heptad repeat protein
VKQRTTALRIGAAFVVAPAVLVLVSGPALAAGGDVVVTNQETVQAHLDPSGAVKDARVYEQLAMQGQGSVRISDPVSPKNLRNLDGFGGFDIRNGRLLGTFDVDGERRVRTVSDFDRALPLKVRATYTLNGKAVQPGDVVGSDGTLGVHYVVQNVTGKQQDVSYDDGTGTQVTSAQNVVIPMVGSLTTTLPSQFTDVKSAEANMAGDGHGGTKLSFTMTLFGPIGSPTAEFGYTAKVSDGVVPPASIAALPVSPLDSPSFKGGAASYKGGADTGMALTAGATEIDANVLKLRDGSATLLAGLLKLRAGADQLNTGLAGEAAPGANALASGAGQLKDGAGKLAAGAGTAKDGSGQIADGTGQLVTGADKLAAGARQVGDGGKLLATKTGDAEDGAVAIKDGAGQLKDGLDQASAKAPALITGLGQVQDGLQQVDDGLTQLYGGIGQLPAKAKPLHDGIAQLRKGIGSTSDPESLVGGVDQLRQQVDAAGPGIQDMMNGVFMDASTKDASGAYQKLGCAVKVVNDLRTGRAPGSITSAEDKFCYGDNTPVLNNFGISPENPANVPRVTILTTLADELGKGQRDLSDASPSRPDIDQKAPSDATLWEGLA